MQRKPKGKEPVTRLEQIEKLFSQGAGISHHRRWQTGGRLRQRSVRNRE